MTPEQKAAFIIAQAALLNAKVAMMQAENQWRVQCGESIAYAEEEMDNEIHDLMTTLEHNAVLSMFRR